MESTVAVAIAISSCVAPLRNRWLDSPLHSLSEVNTLGSAGHGAGEGTGYRVGRWDAIEMRGGGARAVIARMDGRSGGSKAQYIGETTGKRATAAERRLRSSLHSSPVMMPDRPLRVGSSPALSAAPPGLTACSSAPRPTLSRRATASEAICRQIVGRTPGNSRGK